MRLGLVRNLELELRIVPCSLDLDGSPTPSGDLERMVWIGQAVHHIASEDQPSQFWYVCRVSIVDDVGVEHCPTNQREGQLQSPLDGAAL